MTTTYVTQETQMTHLGFKRQDKSDRYILHANIKNRENYVHIPSTQYFISKQPGFFGYDFKTTLRVLAKKKLSMPPPALFLPYRLKLHECIEGKIILHDGAGDPLSQDEAKQLYFASESIQERSLIWLNASFIQGSGYRALDIETSMLKNGKLHSQRFPLEVCIDDDANVDLGSLNQQGLFTQKAPQENISENSIFQLIPLRNHVARFTSYKSWRSLDCAWAPESSGTDLGTFACVEGTLLEESSRHSQFQNLREKNGEK